MRFHSDEQGAGKQGRKVLLDNLTPIGGVPCLTRSKLRVPPSYENTKETLSYRESTPVGLGLPRKPQRTPLRNFPAALSGLSGLAVFGAGGAL